MNQRFQDILHGKEGNYLLPFFWQHQSENRDISGLVQKIQESGCLAFCVESRPYEDFCGPHWWEDMAAILKEAQKRGMRVWILDDKHFPTGYANGLVKEKHPQHRRWYLREHHADLMGPMKDGALLKPPCGPEEELISVCAYRRTGKGEELEGEPVLLGESLVGNYLYWDVPEGCWRVFFIFKTRGPESLGDFQWYINMLSRESVQVLIEAVYESHYRHFSEYFGNTLAGFFSDEPGLYCPHAGPWGQDSGSYYRTVGQPGLALPWDDAVKQKMREAGLKDPLSSLPGVWYSVRDKSPEIRLAFMDAVTLLWKENFSFQLGDWCRVHGVQYIGHIIEDMNTHARLGCSGGHYFRSLEGQDMSGIDIVLHQVMPGMAGYSNAAAIANGTAGTEFFHYVLAQLGASQARLTPHMAGRAMCEEFGAFGWAEGVPFMKWMTDFLLIRGINHFVPHAFTDLYPDPDCPPHFYAQGNDPQFEGFSQLMRYTNRVSHLLFQAERETPGAVFYHAEAEWMSGPSCMMTEQPAKTLYDACIDYDIVSLDMLKSAKAENGSLMIAGFPHRFLVVPWAEHFPKSMWEEVSRLHRQGVPVFFAGDFSSVQTKLPGKAVPVENLAQTVLDAGLAHCYASKAPLLRIARFMRGSSCCFMLFNESVTQTARTDVRLPLTGNYLTLDLLTEEYEKSSTPDGQISVELTPYQSLILLFDDYEPSFLESFPSKSCKTEDTLISCEWEISLLETGKDTEYRSLCKTGELFNITGLKGRPDFSGKMRYHGTFWTDSAGNRWLDLGRVGHTAELTVNGIPLGMRICPPYRWNLGDAIRSGENALEVVVSNTLVHRLKDPLSRYMPIDPSGLLGPVVLF